MKITCSECNQENYPHITVTAIWTRSPHKGAAESMLDVKIVCGYCGRRVALVGEERKKYFAFFFALMPVQFQNLFTWLREQVL